MSKLAHEQMLYTVKELAKRKARRLEGIKQADSFRYECSGAGTRIKQLRKKRGRK